MFEESFKAIVRKVSPYLLMRVPAPYLSGSPCIYPDKNKFSAFGMEGGGERWEIGCHWERDSTERKRKKKLMVLGRKPGI